MLKIKLAIIGALALFYGANGLAMFFTPETWYGMVPGVPDTGPFNAHFIRDIGLIYATLSVALILALSVRRLLYPLTLLPCIWVGLHAGLHLWDIAADRLPLEHLLIDLPGVFAPALLHGVLSWWVKPDWEASLTADPSQ